MVNLAFVNGKLYEFTRIPFGMKNGVAAFQRTISQFIKEENLSNTYAYLDNVTVAGSTQLEHDRNVKAFIDAIRGRSFTLNENKTLLALSLILKFLGTLLETNALSPILNV